MKISDKIANEMLTLKDGHIYFKVVAHNIQVVRDGISRSVGHKTLETEIWHWTDQHNLVSIFYHHYLMSVNVTVIISTQQLCRMSRRGTVHLLSDAYGWTENQLLWQMFEFMG